MKKVLFLLILISFFSCRENITPVIVEDDVIEIPAEDSEDNEDDYITEGLFTKITSVVGEKTPQYVDEDIGCNSKYKYEENRYIATKGGLELTITTDKPNNLVSVSAFQIGDDFVKFDSLVRVSDKVWKCRIKLNSDSVQTKTATIACKSSDIVYNTPQGNVLDNPTRKLKIVSRLNGHLYGSNEWFVEYFKIVFGTQSSTFSQSTITSDYIAQKGDILIWQDGTKGTISTDATTRIISGGIRENRFKVSAMNLRCKNEKTIKSYRTKSSDFGSTFISAQASRGTPVFYQRVN